MDAPKVLAKPFPFAYPVPFHAKALGALRASSLTNLFLLTRSAHHGLLVAASESGLEVVILAIGPPGDEQDSKGPARWGGGGRSTPPAETAPSGPTPLGRPFVGSPLGAALGLRTKRVPTARTSSSKS